MYWYGTAVCLGLFGHVHSCTVHCCCIIWIYIYKGSGRGRLGAPRPPWRVRVECEEVFVLELSGTHELHTINTTYQVADVRPSGPRWEWEEVYFVFRLSGTHELHTKWLYEVSKPLSWHLNGWRYRCCVRGNAPRPLSEHRKRLVGGIKYCIYKREKPIAV